MAKVDLKNAFRLCPVRPKDWHLLGIYWHDSFYIDKCFPYGLRSAPFLFNMIADALHWILQHYFGKPLTCSTIWMIFSLLAQPTHRIVTKLL